MNETQRQALADNIDRVSQQIDSLEANIADEQPRLDRKKVRLERLKAEKAALEEGIDW